MEDMMKMIQALSALDNLDPDIKEILEMDTSDLNDEIENEALLKEVIESLRNFIPAAKRMCTAYFRLYQKKEAGELE